MTETWYSGNYYSTPSMDDSKEHRKILHIITKATWGGAQVYVFDLLCEAQKRGFEPVLIYGTNGELSERVVGFGIRTLQTNSLERDVHILGDIKTLFSLYKIIQKECPDVVHVHSSKAGLLGSIAARLARTKKIVFTAHGWPHNESRPDWQKIIFRFLEWLTILFSTNTIAVSETMHAQAPDLFLQNKITVIRNGIDSFSLYGKENARAALNLFFPAQTFVFGTIAELHKNKGLDVLIQAFANIHKQYPLAKLCIIGGGDEKSNLEKRIAQEKLTDAVLLLGNIPNAKEYLRAFTVFVLPSRTEALGYVLLEAGMSKIPCVGTRVGGIPEIIEHNKTGILVSKEDVRELTLALEFSLTHKHEMETYAKNLHEKVLAVYSKKEMLDKIFTLYSTPKNS